MIQPHCHGNHPLENGAAIDSWALGYRAMIFIKAMETAC